DRSTAASRNRNFTNFVPELQANLNFWWYPYEWLQVKAGFDVMAFFNTMSSPQPVDFNFGSLTPAWESTTRYIHGFNFWAAFIFSRGPPPRPACGLALPRRRGLPQNPPPPCRGSPHRV